MNWGSESNYSESKVKCKQLFDCQPDGIKIRPMLLTQLAHKLENIIEYATRVTLYKNHLVNRSSFNCDDFWNYGLKRV